MKHYVILLATDDPEVEVVVRSIGTSVECECNCARTSRDAVSMMMDSASDEALAVVDLDLPESGRTLLRTAGGAMPVIAIAAREKPWLASMLHHRQIDATVLKPVSAEKLRGAFDRVRRSALSALQRGR